MKKYIFSSNETKYIGNWMEILWAPPIRLDIDRAYSLWKTDFIFYQTSYVCFHVIAEVKYHSLEPRVFVLFCFWHPWPFICYSLVSNTLLKNSIHLFLERGERREEERERNIDWLPLTSPHLGTWPATQARTLYGIEPVTFLVHRLGLNPLSHTSQAVGNIILDACLLVIFCQNPILSAGAVPFPTSPPSSLRQLCLAQHCCTSV